MDGHPNAATDSLDAEKRAVPHHEWVITREHVFDCGARD
jgi:hypothetical protein